MNMESLKALCQQILEHNEGMNDDLINKIEKLYEEALLTQFLAKRQEALEAIYRRVETRAQSESQAQPKVAPSAPAPKEEAESTPPPTSTFGDEVKVLPHPEGPPKPERKPEPAPTPPPAPKVSAQEEMRKVLEERTVESPKESSSSARSPKLNIGLNDRIAFVKQLFMGSQEDYQRVISQINTMDEYAETIDFIENVVKPDYDWSKVEETENRLLELVAHRFNV